MDWQLQDSQSGPGESLSCVADSLESSHSLGRSPIPPTSGGRSWLGQLATCVTSQGRGSDTAWAGLRELPRGPEWCRGDRGGLAKGRSFQKCRPQFPAPHSGRPLAGALPLIWEVTRDPGFRKKLGRGRERPTGHSALTLQLLAFVLLGLMLFEQAGQHGRVWLGVGTTGPSLRLRKPDYGLARPERSHVIEVPRDAGSSLTSWRWVLGIEEIKEGSGGLFGG